jgi:hypothetical protein
MTQDTQAPSTLKWTSETIIDLIRKVRNDLIKDFLDDRFLREYMAQQFNIAQLPPLKIEFIRTELKELLISPVSIDHYHLLIEQIRETDSAALSEGNEALFYREIEKILRKYTY